MSVIYVIIGKHACSDKDIRKDCKDHADMVQKRDEMLAQGYSLIINRIETEDRK